jgi:hypothetical protein
MAAAKLFTENSSVHLSNLGMAAGLALLPWRRVQRRLEGREGAHRGGQVLDVADVASSRVRTS